MKEIFWVENVKKTESRYPEWGTRGGGGNKPELENLSKILLNGAHTFDASRGEET